MDRMKTAVWEQPSHPENRRLLEARLKYFPVAHQKGTWKQYTHRGGKGRGGGKGKGGGQGRYTKYGVEMTSSSQYSQYNLSLVRVELETGRKHQIRAQMSYIGHPIVGDGKYGAPQALRDIPLHSHMLEFHHPTQQDVIMSFYSYPPDLWAVRYGQEIKEGVNSLIPEIQEDEGVSGARIHR